MFKEYSKEIAEKILKDIWFIEVKQMEDKYSMIITSEVEDRDWEVVKINWIDTTNYIKNPVVLQDHSYKVEDVIWKTISIKKSWNNLLAEFVFANTEYWILAKELYDNWFLKTASIWFIVNERDPNNRNIITKSELLEWSLVAVPCNPEALSLDWKALFQKGLEAWILKEEVIEDNQEENKLDLEKELKEVKNELLEIKTLLKNLADDKAKNEDLQKLEQEALNKKQILQTIDNAVGEALKNIKLLK